MVPGEGAMSLRIKGSGAATSVLFALSLALTGCEDIPWNPDRWGLDHIDVLAVNGRDGDAPMDYDTLMRIGAAARASGDLPNALSLYRRAGSLESHPPAPFIAIGNTLLEMGQADEAIIAFNSALSREERNPEALRGVARAYLKTARPELAGQPLALAFEGTPNDPKLLMLIGVADDFVDQHGEAQARYRRGLEIAPGDPGLTLNLALSLALTGDYDQAIARLGPLAGGPSGTPQDRQTLALIYGLKGDRRTAERLASIDLDPAAVQHNLAAYDNLRRLSPEARSRAIRALVTSAGGARSS
ncbi:MAG TPA: tetratricopeptide repeat protein [Xanthobacteraceae bacterium]|jgi:Flp pilus assembly protein TadD